MAAGKINITAVVGTRYSWTPICKYAASSSEVDFLEMTTMNFIEKARSLSLGQKVASAAGLLGVACMVSLLFDTGSSVAQATTNPTSYVGIWKMTAQDKRLGTLELMNYNGRLTGSITNARAIPGAAPIVQASTSQGMLAINTEEIDETIVPWNMTLTGEGKGILQLAFKGHEMIFQITRISWEENEESSETGK
jgi:hypothetical protein